MYWCTAVAQAINFVTNPRADAPARYTVERATLQVHIIIEVYAQKQELYLLTI